MTERQPRPCPGPPSGRQVTGTQDHPAADDVGRFYGARLRRSESIWRQAMTGGRRPFVVHCLEVGKSGFLLPGTREPRLQVLPRRTWSGSPALRLGSESANLSVVIVCNYSFDPITAVSCRTAKTYFHDVSILFRPHQKHTRVLWPEPALWKLEVIDVSVSLELDVLLVEAAGTAPASTNAICMPRLLS